MAIICLLFAGMNCYKPPMSAKLTIGFLGAGKMGTALAKGFINAGLATADQIIASDPVEAAGAAFAKEVGAKVTASRSEVLPEPVGPVITVNLSWKETLARSLYRMKP